MKRSFDVKINLFWWCAGGALFVAVLGTILHFLYEWTGQSNLAKPFSAIDESTWQHMKIMYFPMLIYGVAQRFFFKREYPCFALVKLAGIVVGLVLIPVLFYTYNGAIGKSPDWLNITIFMIAGIGAFATEYALFKREKTQSKWCNLAYLGIVFIGVLMIVFTYLPPDLQIFKSPV